MISPSPGSKIYSETFASGMVYDSVAGTKVEPHLVDGNHVTASQHPRPWEKQLNIIAANLYFYNLLRFITTLLTPGRPKRAHSPHDATDRQRRHAADLGQVDALGLAVVAWRHRSPRGSARQRLADAVTGRHSCRPCARNPCTARPVAHGRADASGKCAKPVL